MTDNKDDSPQTGDDERRAGAGRRREPRYDWETGDPIKDRRLQDEDGYPEEDEVEP